VQYLLEQTHTTVDIHLANTLGMTALHCAAMVIRDDSPAIIDLLLHAGAAIRAQDHYGDTPLHFLYQYLTRRLFHVNLPTTVSILLRQDPGLLNLPNNDGDTALHLVCHVELAKALLERFIPETKSWHVSITTLLLKNNRDETPRESIQLRFENSRQMENWQPEDDTMMRETMEYVDSYSSKPLIIRSNGESNNYQVYLARRFYMHLRRSDLFVNSCPVDNLCSHILEYLAPIDVATFCLPH
jgi:ankyrin repeat protein